MSITSEWSALLEVIDTTPSISLTVRPAPSASEVERAEALTAAVWPEQLREFFSLHGGQGPNDLGELLPQSELFDLDRVVAEHQMMVELGRQMIAYDPEYYSLDGDSAEAGTQADVFLPSYIPFGGADGYLFFCDARPGPHTGCIRQWHKEGADEGGPSWLTFTDMLRAVRTSITENSPLIEFPESAGWWPHHYEGNLIWTPDELDLDEEAAAPLETSLPEPTPIDIPFPLINFLPSQVGPDDDIVDLEVIAQTVLKAARMLHPYAHIEGGQTVFPRLPRRQGINANFFVSVNGEQRVYFGVLTGDGDDIIIFEHPPEGSGGFIVVNKDAQ
ncbi:MAG: hypothetical protein C0482_00975 [Gordonia sp.]|nr:hypothetical protein [Gordonia sp. (in: high G+C Gram-positive bacteria)]